MDDVWVHVPAAAIKKAPLLREDGETYRKDTVSGRNSMGLFEFSMAVAVATV